MPENASIKIKCPNCGAIARGTEAHLGRAIKCPKCGRTDHFIRQASADVSAAEGRCASCGKLVPVSQMVQSKESTAMICFACEATEANSDVHVRSNDPPPAHPSGEELFRGHLKIAVWAAGGGLLILALSPLFHWIKFGTGGVAGISGDGKIVLGISIAALVAYGVAITQRRWIAPILLGIQAWGTMAVLWMGALIWKVGSILDTPEMKDNPFATLFAAQISPGFGLYLGLIGALAVAGSLGFLAFQYLGANQKRVLYYTTQGGSLILGMLLALFVGPERAGGHRDSNKSSHFQATPFAGDSDGWDNAPAIAVGKTELLGHVAVTPLGIWKAPITYKKGGFMGDEIKRDANPALLFALRAQNKSEGQVFAPAPAFSDAHEIAEVVDNFGNRSFVSGMCQFAEWPAIERIGREPTKLPPGESAVLVFIVNKLENEKASGFTWRIKLAVDNEFKTQRMTVSTPANTIHIARPTQPPSSTELPELGGTTPTGVTAQDQETQEKKDYIKSVKLYDLKAKRYTSVLEERMPGVEFKLRNDGARILSKVKVTVYFKDGQGKTIAEEDYHPVLVSGFSLNPSTPLKAGYIWQLERGKFLQAKNVPTEWQEGNVEAKVTEVDFAPPADDSARSSPESQSYLKELDLYDLQAKYYTTVLDERVPGVEFKLKNRGNRQLKLVKVTVFFRDANDKVIAEEDYHPVLVTDSPFNRSTPLKPGYIWQMERGKFYQAKSVPTEWKEGNVVAKITDVEFAAEQ